MTRLPPIRLDKDFNPGKARWCEQHRRLECTKRRTNGAPVCHKAATRGINACSTHAGLRSTVAKTKGEALITAWSAIGSAAEAVDHKMAVLGVLQMTWLRLHGYSELLRQQVAADSRRAEGIEGAEGTEGAGSSEGTEGARTGGLIGYQYGAAGRDGNIYAQSEQIRALVELEARERERVVKFAKTAHDMGISDRMVELAERWTDVVSGKVNLILEGLNLTPEQELLVPALVTEHLSAIDMNPATPKMRPAAGAPETVEGEVVP